MKTKQILKYNKKIDTHGLFSKMLVCCEECDAWGPEPWGPPFVWFMTAAAF